LFLINLNVIESKNRHIEENAPTIKLCVTGNSDLKLDISCEIFEIVCKIFEIVVVILESIDDILDVVDDDDGSGVVVDDDGSGVVVDDDGSGVVVVVLKLLIDNKLNLFFD